MSAPPRPVLIIGGAGFIGANLADALLADGQPVVLFDNLSRPGVERNARWLAKRHGARVRLVVGDIRDSAVLADLVGNASAVFHFAAQVAVTTSLDNPFEDFAVNAQGTLGVLEAVRLHSPSLPVIFASTNKVYGGLADLSLRLTPSGYVPEDARVRERGISEVRPLDFCTPYGCSKGAADQYVLDYAKSFDMRTAVLRMSCIYGPRQFGTEDQGWVAHFTIRALRDEPIIIFGDGYQVRDILHVADAVAAYRAVLANIETVRGQAFNLGGGPDNAVSLQTVLTEIRRLVPNMQDVTYDAPRIGDQNYYVADTRKLTEAVGWWPTIGWREGLRDLLDWMQSDALAAEQPARMRLRA